MTTAETIIQNCRDLIELLPSQALAAAREKRPELRGFAVFPVYAPQEIIHAAGLLPVGVFGAGGKLETTQADSRFQSFICSIAKSTLELFLCGDLSEKTGFDGAVFSSICDVARNLTSVVSRNAPGVYIEYLHLPQNAATEAARDYTRLEFHRFRNNLSQQIGRPIPDEAIARSITIYNRLRELVSDLYEHRQARPGTIRTADLFAVVMAGTCMMPEDFIEMAESLLADLRDSVAVQRDTVNVVLEGAFCEAPPIDLLDAIESAGCQIMDDDLAIGWRMFSREVSAQGDPVANLADAYLSSSAYTSVRHNNGQPRTKGLLERVHQSRADAVILASAKFCEPALFDYVLFRHALDKKDIPHLKIEFEEKMWTFERLRNEIETFTESLLFD